GHTRQLNNGLVSDVSRNSERQVQRMWLTNPGRSQSRRRRRRLNCYAVRGQDVRQGNSIGVQAAAVIVGQSHRYDPIGCVPTHRLQRSCRQLDECLSLAGLNQVIVRSFVDFEEEPTLLVQNTVESGVLGHETMAAACPADIGLEPHAMTDM